MYQSPFQYLAVKRRLSGGNKCRLEFLSLIRSYINIKTKHCLIIEIPYTKGKVNAALHFMRALELNFGWDRRQSTEYRLS